MAVNGSERDGNTAELLRYVAGIAHDRGVDFDVINLRELRVDHCGACGDCNFRTEPCTAQDDVAGAVARMVDSDGVIYAAPVHGFGTASLMQAFIERSGVGYLRFDRPLTNKVAGVIAVGRRYSQGEVWAQLVVNALLNRMIVVGSGFPAHITALHKGEALQDEEGVANVTRMVDRMIDMIELLRERGRSGEPVLEPRERNERVGLPANF